MSRMNTQERTIFLNNLDRMLSLLNCTYKNINIKYAYFPIPRTTIYRWMTGNTYPNKDWSWGEEFLSFYNQIFDPEIEDSKEFFQKKLSYMQLKEKFVFDDFTKQYLGNCFIYYFSNHYENIIHGGKICIQNKDGLLTGRLVLGIQDTSQYNNKLFSKIFDKNIDNNEANIRFQEFKKAQPTDLRQRCYFYEGKIFIDNYILRIEFIGKGNRKNHKQTLFLNIVKRPQTIKSYKGGLGLVLAAPNDIHTDFRIYKMGLSKCELPFNSNKLKRLLKIESNSFNRFSLTVYDDQAWYDEILLKE